MSTLKQRVYSAMCNAQENGHVLGSDPVYIAEDLMQYDSDLEDEDLDEVIEAVEEVLGHE